MLEKLLKSKLLLHTLVLYLKTSIRKKYFCRITRVLLTTKTASNFQKAVTDLAHNFFPVTVLFMCNYTQKSSKTINQALTCMKA